MKSHILFGSEILFDIKKIRLSRINAKCEYNLYTVKAHSNVYILHKIHFFRSQIIKHEAVS